MKPSDEKAITFTADDLSEVIGEVQLWLGRTLTILREKPKKGNRDLCRRNLHQLGIYLRDLQDLLQVVGGVPTPPQEGGA